MKTNTQNGTTAIPPASIAGDASAQPSHLIGNTTPLLEEGTSDRTGLSGRFGPDDGDLEKQRDLAPPTEDEARSIFRDLIFSLPIAMMNMMGQLNGVFVTQKYTIQAQVPTDITALSALVSGLTSAVFVLVLSLYGDNLRTRFGRRKPIIVVSAVAACVTAYFLIYPQVRLTPDNANAAGDYLMWVQLATTLAQDTLTITYYAWAAELTTGSGPARARLFGILTATNLLVSVLMPILVVSMHLTNSQAVKDTKWLRDIAPGLMLAVYLLVCAIERDRGGETGETDDGEKEEPNSSNKKMSFLPAVRCCTRNRPWLVYLAVKICFDLMQAGMSDLNYVLFYLYRVPKQDMVYRDCALVLCQQLAGVAGALGLGSILQRVDRVKIVGVFTGCLSAAFVVWAGLLFLAPKNPSLVPLYVLISLIGCGLGAFTAVLQIISNDVIDYDELLSGKRREAVYKSLTNVPSQFITIGMSALPSITLGVTGIQSFGTPSADKASAAALLGMRAWITWFPACVLAVGTFIWFKYYPLSPSVFDSMAGQVAVMRKDRAAALYDPVAGRSFHALEIVAEHAAPGDKDVAEYMRYFSRRDLLAFAEGWRKRWLWKYAIDLVAWTAFALALLVEGGVSFRAPFGDGGLTQDAHRSLSVLLLLAGAGCLFPAAYYALQWTGVRWALRQTKACMRRYVDEMSRLDVVVRRTLSAASSASERGGVAAALGGGWQRIVRHQVLTLAGGVALVVVLHCLCFQSPSAPSCHASARVIIEGQIVSFATNANIEQFCVKQSVGKSSCLSLKHLVPLPKMLGGYPLPPEEVCAWQ